MPPVTPPPFLDYINYRINELARFKGDEKGNPLTILASTVAAVVKRSLRKIDAGRRHSFRTKAEIKGEKSIDTCFKVLTRLLHG